MTQLEVPFEFRRLIERVGMDFNLSQGLGGNCSVKSKRNMLVKASGRRLAAINDPGYFHRVVLTSKGFSDSILRQSTHPSIETFLHADLPGKFVLHLHSLRSIATSMVLGNSKTLRAELKEDALALVPYARPGRELRDEIRKIRRVSHFASAFVLANHGILVSGDSVHHLEDQLSKLENLFSRVLGPVGNRSIGPIRSHMRLSAQDTAIVRWHAQNNWRISPDHVVFLGHEAPTTFVKTLQGCPRVGDLIGDFSAGSTLSVESEQLLAFINIALMLPQETLPTLTQKESLFLANWESEKARKKAAQNEN